MDAYIIKDTRLMTAHTLCMLVTDDLVFVNEITRSQFYLCICYFIYIHANARGSKKIKKAER